MINQMQSLSDEQIRAGFVASCVESVAKHLNCAPSVIWNRMMAVELIDKYLFACYDVLHTESREAVTLDVLETLELWEKRKKTL